MISVCLLTKSNEVLCVLSVYPAWLKTHCLVTVLTRLSVIVIGSGEGQQIVVFNQVLLIFQLCFSEEDAFPKCASAMLKCIRVFPLLAVTRISKK